MRSASVGDVKLAILTYSYVENMGERREPHRAEHLALIDDYLERGRLLLAGATGDPPSGGVIVLSDEGSAAEFTAADPYRRAGLVTHSSVAPWNVVAQRPLPGGGG